MNFESFFAEKKLNIPVTGMNAVLDLNLEGATVPFIARYRKEKTGNLDETQIRQILESKENFDEICKRQNFITQEIEKQGKLSDELKTMIAQTFDLDRLEDIYLPFKLKRKTKAMIAKEQGLDIPAELAMKIFQGVAISECDSLVSWNKYLESFISEEKKLATSELVSQGIHDIVVEKMSLDLALREFVRSEYHAQGFLISKKGPKAQASSKFENYFEYAESVKSLKEGKNSHRYLALRRGWMEEELIVSLGFAPLNADQQDAKLVQRFESFLSLKADSFLADFAHKAVKTALKAHVFPSVESEIHRVLKEMADLAAIKVFAENVRNLLLAAPYGAKATLGVDPGIRTGCKLAIINSNGHFVASTVIHPETPLGQKEAEKIVLSCLDEAKISAIAVGNGTAGRETEVFLRKVLEKATRKDVPVVMVSEAGASVYSASVTAKEEFPDLDVTIRGAISIARRFQDPLAELVKIDPKSIGVGQYQHDVQQNQLKKSLEEVVDSCVNFVGVNLNTASYHLLEHVSGIGPALAKALVEHRHKNGPYKNREALLQVPRFSQKAFEQSAGFLRIPESENPLDNTGVHPEKYPQIIQFSERKKMSLKDLVQGGVAELESDEEFKIELGEFTFKDVISELKKPGRDPRDPFVPFQFRDDIHEISDLKAAMICPGIVTNVTNFGAFVDIGVHQDGLVHISQLTDRFISDPREVVKPGDHVQVKVLEIDHVKKKIALTMKMSESAPARAPREFQAPAPRMQRPPMNTNRPVQAGQNSSRPTPRAPVGAPMGNQPRQGAQQNRPMPNRPMPKRPAPPRGNEANQSRSEAPRRQNDFKNNAFSQFSELANAFGKSDAQSKGSKK